ncbi:hypothetical protein ACFSUJ_00185 [Streptomyces lusitanus]|uniref:SWIM-type domain-containing protein n=1 Tax=Streptomyces lusitanus TaxID=68232 RepID=A0ABU3K0G8_9ACTN|nr:hypothetical protein [Streptomyces lusitanus]
MEDARVRMLPGYGDLDAGCGCDALDHPCGHATALADQLSWLLDTDPWLLLLIRGRDALEGFRAGSRPRAPAPRWPRPGRRRKSANTGPRTRSAPPKSDRSAVRADSAA